MTKFRIRRTGSGYQAAPRGVTRPGTGTPDSHSARGMVDPTCPEEEDKSYLRRSPFAFALVGLPEPKGNGIQAEKSADAIVAAAVVRPRRRAESSIAGSRLRDPRAG